jgi:hypothetical protein
MSAPTSAPPAGSAEMISGPDLGGGFLHQLTRARTADGARFTFHAQDGGEDAGGPPKGSPEALGWALASGMCPIGGRRCWQRSFELTDAETALVRAAYQRTRLVMELSIEQAAGRAQPTWEAAFAEAAERIEAADRADPIPWALGAASLDRRTGAPAPTGEIILVTTEAGVPRIAAALRDYLIEPAAPTDWASGRVVAGRAFVGTPREGARVGWRAASGRLDLGPTAERNARPAEGPSRVSWAGRTVAVTTL